jgi:PBSX family phage terminase large subunit
MALNDLYSKKQQQVLQYAMSHDFFMLINDGAKRSGKTMVDNDIFLYELRRVKVAADKAGVLLPQYILAGADLSAIRRNVLNELTNKYGLQFSFDKSNRFKLFGVLVCCFGHSKINDLGRIRGMTSWGAYINECSVANPHVFDEIKSRCSAPGARLIMDTNPDRPSHWLKTDYIDKADGKTIKRFHWKLNDNTFLSRRYIESIKASTPGGMFYERDINGEWVAAAGVVYPDFDPNVNYISAKDVPHITRYFAGMDFGWEHTGAIVLMGEDADGRLYLLREWSAKHRSINDWVRIVREEIEPITSRITLYCDSARPDLINEMVCADLDARQARKDVVAGISTVATLFKTRKLFVVKENVKEFKTEIESYVWKEDEDAPIKENDDIMDALRYAVYSDKIDQEEAPRLNEDAAFYDILF